ncbi:Fc.00g085020.m01.CDS01 [Cosmosporella sp. VM-42]
MSSQAQTSTAQSSLAHSNSGQPSTQAIDLWQTALDNLDDDLKASLNFKNSTKRDILEKTLKVAEDKWQLCLRKRWKFKRHGKEVVVRDILEKIIKWLDHFKAVGISLLNMILLTLRCHGQAYASYSSDTHVFGSTISGLETVSHLIARYAIFEGVHMRRNTAASAELEPLLTKLYADLLIFLARAKKYFQTPTAARMLKATLVNFQTDED